MLHEKSHAAILIGVSDIRTAESAIQEFARKVPDPLSRKVGSGNETNVLSTEVVLSSDCILCWN